MFRLRLWFGSVLNHSYLCVMWGIIFLLINSTTVRYDKYRVRFASVALNIKLIFDALRVFKHVIVIFSRYFDKELSLDMEEFWARQYSTTSSTTSLIINKKIMIWRRISVSKQEQNKFHYIITFFLLIILKLLLYGAFYFNVTLKHYSNQMTFNFRNFDKKYCGSF